MHIMDEQRDERDLDGDWEVRAAESGTGALAAVSETDGDGGLPERLRKIAEHMRTFEFSPYTVVVSEQDIAKFATAIGADDRAYFDADAARAKHEGARGPVAPRAYFLGIGTTRGRVVPRSDYGADGLPAIERLADTRLVVGGSETEYFEDIYAGDEVTVEQEIGSIKPRVGMSGPMLLIELIRRYSRADGTLLVLDRITQIVR